MATLIQAEKPSDSDHAKNAQHGRKLIRLRNEFGLRAFHCLSLNEEARIVEEPGNTIVRSRLAEDQVPTYHGIRPGKLIRITCLYCAKLFFIYMSCSPYTDLVYQGTAAIYLHESGRFE